MNDHDAAHLFDGGAEDDEFEMFVERTKQQRREALKAVLDTLVQRFGYSEADESLLQAFYVAAGVAEE